MSRKPSSATSWTGILLFCFLLLAAGVVLIQTRLDHIRRMREKLKAADELMYFPSGSLLSAVAGEFRLLAADFAWLQVVQYSGAHLGLANQEQNYRWVGNAVEVIGTLDPHFIEPYVFGAQILGWSADQPSEGVALLRKGFEQNPLDWRLPFQAGFIAYEVLKTGGYNLAGHYFSLAAELPGVWSVAPRLAAAAYAKVGNFELTRQIWTEVLANQQNPTVKQIAKRQLVDLMAREVKYLQAAVDTFTGTEHRFPAALQELADRHYIEQTPAEPFGGNYVLRAGKVLSTSVENTRLILRGLQRLANNFAAARRRPPRTIQELVDAGYIDTVPTEPFGGDYEIQGDKVVTTTDLSAIPQ